MTQNKLKNLEKSLIKCCVYLIGCHMRAKIGNRGYPVLRKAARDNPLEIGKIRRLHHIPVIIYSTSSNKASIREAERLGATDYFIKPSSISELTQKLVQLLKS